MRYIANTESVIKNEIPISNDGIIITTDTNKMFVDYGGDRYQITDIIYVKSMTALRTVQPIIGKLYFVEDEVTFYFYKNGWTKFGSGDNDVAQGNSHITTDVKQDTSSKVSTSDTITYVDLVERDGYGHVKKINKASMTLPKYTHPLLSAMKTTSASAPNAGSKVTMIDAIEVDESGHITKINTKTITLPAGGGSSSVTHPTIPTTTDTTKSKETKEGDTIAVVDSVDRDSNGHVKKINTTNVKLPVASHIDIEMNDPMINGEVSTNQFDVLNSIVIDEYGHVTGYETANITVTEPVLASIYDKTQKILSVNTANIGTLKSPNFIVGNDNCQLKGAANSDGIYFYYGISNISPTVMVFTNESATFGNLDTQTVLTGTSISLSSDLIINGTYKRLKFQGTDKRSIEMYFDGFSNGLVIRQVDDTMNYQVIYSENGVGPLKVGDNRKPMFLNSSGVTVSDSLHMGEQKYLTFGCCSPYAIKMGIDSSSNFIMNYFDENESSYKNMISVNPTDNQIDIGGAGVTRIATTAKQFIHTVSTMRTNDPEPFVISVANNRVFNVLGKSSIKFGDKAYTEEEDDTFPTMMLEVRGNINLVSPRYQDNGMISLVPTTGNARITGLSGWLATAEIDPAGGKYLCFYSKRNTFAFAYNTSSANKEFYIYSGYTAADGTFTTGVKLHQKANDSDRNYFGPASYEAGKTCDLGSPTFLWDNIYCKNDAIQTSDRELKKDIQNIPEDTAVALVEGLKPSSFKFKENNSGRTHYGFIAQDVEDLANSLGIETKDFAVVCKDRRTKIVEVTEMVPKKEVDDETGEITWTEEEETFKKAVEIPEGEEGYGYQYGLRYEELIAPIVAHAQYLSKEVEDLKKENAELKETMELILSKLR